MNFATGSMALFTAYTYAYLRNGQLLILIPGLRSSVSIGQPLSLVPAALIALAIAAAFGALLYAVVFRPLREAPPLARAVASLGVLVVVEGLIQNRVGQAPVSVSAIFPSARWHWGSLVVLSDRLYLVFTVVALALVITALYRWTRFGLLTRAVAETHTGSIVSGISPSRIALLNWMASAVVAGAAGILIAPITTLTPEAYTLAVVPALAAAVVGRFELMVPTVIAGIAIGMLQSGGLTLAVQHAWFPQTGSAELIPLLVILATFIVSGRGIPVRAGFVRKQLGRAPRPHSLLLPTIVGIAVGVLALVLTTGTWRNAVIGTLIAAILGLSYVVVTGLAGQVSLAQLALAGVSAFSLSVITQSWGIPFPIAPLLAALFASCVGVVVGLPALRLRGLTLGIVTLAFAYAIEALWFENGQFVNPAGATVKSPHLFGLDLGIGTGAAFPRLSFGLLCLVTLAAVALGVALLRMSSLGSAMLTVRINERSAAGIGVNVARVKIASFAISSFIAGIGGCLFAYGQGTVTFASFDALGGLALLSTVYLAGITSVSGGILGGVLASAGIVSLVFGQWLHLGSWFAVLSGVALIVTLIRFPEGLAAGGHALFRRMPQVDLKLHDRVSRRKQSLPQPAPLVVTPPIPIHSGTNPALEIRGLGVHYGGVVAVSDVSLQVETGKVVGLIGPNGAGKTSVIDAVTGFTRADGTILLNGERIESLPAHARVHRGLARTFQSLELYDDLTVEENVSAAAFSAARKHRNSQVTAALQRASLEGVRHRHAEELSQGERQLVSITRACVSNPSVLLLDEPAAGLGPADSRMLGDRIRDIAAAGTAVLLVDHDIDLVMSVCDYIFVLEFGVLIMQGEPAVIRNDPDLAKAYLGTFHDGSAVI